MSIGGGGSVRDQKLLFSGEKGVFRALRTCLQAALWAAGSQVLQKAGIDLGVDKENVN